MHVGSINPRGRGNVPGVTPAQAQPAILRIWQEAHFSVYQQKRIVTYVIDYKLILTYMIKLLDAPLPNIEKHIASYTFI